MDDPTVERLKLLPVGGSADFPGWEAFEMKHLRVSLRLLTIGNVYAFKIARIPGGYRVTRVPPVNDARQGVYASALAAMKVGETREFECGDDGLRIIRGVVIRQRRTWRCLYTIETTATGCIVKKKT